jgi:hypothetical protein
MYDGNPVHIHTGRYPRGIDVSNFVPEERFSGGGVQIWWPFVTKAVVYSDQRVKRYAISQFFRGISSPP